MKLSTEVKVRIAVYHVMTLLVGFAAGVAVASWIAKEIVLGR